MYPENHSFMEKEASTPPVVAKKLWSIVRILFFMLRKGTAKSKIMTELHLMPKRGKLAGKTIVNSLIVNHHHYAAFTCRSHDGHLSFISPRDYEFSCSKTPAHPVKRKNLHFGRFSESYQHDSVATVDAVQKVLEMLNNAEKVEAASPLAGFGKSPIGRQLRVTDSPFPLNEEFEGDGQVDRAAEEFINRFHKDLNMQKTMAAIESPYHSNMWGR